ncbi:MAG: WbuC family cupin fold metalloprotein [Burkholderiales bacterium]|nr:WbuC family cupin fold metalloprotein [Burkholderiales bacterium]
MSGVTAIDRALLDALSAAAAAAPRRRRNRNFHGDLAETCHRLLNAIEPGSYVVPHRHLDPARDETILCLRGRLGLVVFDGAGGIAATRLLEPGGDSVGANLPAGTWHSLVALTPGTVMFEAKAGPYVPPSPADLAPWAPREGDAAAAAYAARLERLFA